MRPSKNIIKPKKSRHHPQLPPPADDFDFMAGAMMEAMLRAPLLQQLLNVTRSLFNFSAAPPPPALFPPPLNFGLSGSLLALFPPVNSATTTESNQNDRDLSSSADNDSSDSMMVDCDLVNDPVEVQHLQRRLTSLDIAPTRAIAAGSSRAQPSFTSNGDGQQIGNHESVPNRRALPKPIGQVIWTDNQMVVALKMAIEDLIVDEWASLKDSF